MGLQKNIIQPDWWSENDEHFNVDRFSSAYDEMVDGHEVSEGPGFSKRNWIVSIKNPNEAIVKIKEMREAVNIGKEASEMTRNAIDSLRYAWRGSDAKVHIDHLRNIRVCMSQVTSMLYEISRSMYYSMKDFSDRTESNLGQAYDLGGFQEIDFGDLFIIDANILDTLEVYVNTEVASEVSKNLKNCYGQFQDLNQRFFALYSYILEVWQSGGVRDKFEENAEKYQTRYTEYLDWFDQAIKALDRAIEVWKLNGNPVS